MHRWLPAKLYLVAKQCGCGELHTSRNSDVLTFKYYICNENDWQFEICKSRYQYQ